MTRLLSVVGLAWLYCTIGELQPIEYLKCVFLEILNVTTWSVFQNKVTYIVDYFSVLNCLRLKLSPEHLYYRCVYKLCILFNYQSFQK